LRHQREQQEWGTDYLGGHGAAEQARAGAQVPNDGAPSQQASRLLQGLQEAQRAGGGAENRRRRHGSGGDESIEGREGEPQPR